MKRAQNRELLKDIYEDNLYAVVRGERRTGRTKPEKPNPTPVVHHRKKIEVPMLLGALLVVAVTYGTVSISQDNSVQSLHLQNSSKPDVVALNAATLKTQTDEINLSLAQTTPSLYRPNLSWGGVDSEFAPPVDLAIKSHTINQMTLLDAPRISLVNLFGLGVKTIVIDPGHGGKDPGAIGKENTYEKDIVLTMALNLRDRLIARGGYRVLMTRSGDQSMSLQQRVNFANKNNADLFISLHLNAFPKKNRNFIETYYFGATDDISVTELAARENADSDYHYADFKNMIQKISDTMKFEESKELAGYIQHSLYHNVKRVSQHTSNHGIKPGPFVVLLGLEVPSILTEIANLTNKAEEKRLNSKAYQDNIAKFLEKGIVNYLNNKTTLGDRVHGEEKEKLAQAW